MTRADFDRWADWGQALSTRRPGAYRALLVAFACFGYLLLGGAFAVVLLASVLCVVLVVKAPYLVQWLVKVIWLPLLLLWALGRAFFTRVPEPEGLEAVTEAYPGLHAAVRELVSRCEALPIDRILLLPEANAFAAEIPRLGPFFPRRVLGLGLPLLLALDEDQMRAVIAHELGHFAARDQRWAGRIYRLRRLWQAFASLDIGWVQHILGWYAPRFEALSLALARAQEVEADRMAVRLCGAPALAGALSRSAALDEVLETRHWAEVRRAVPERPEPPDGVFAELPRVLAEPFPSECLSKPLLRATDTDDSHPALRDRLAAIGEPPRLTRSVPDAARAWLGGRLEESLTRLGELWRQGVAESWQQAHREARQLRETPATGGVDEAFEALADAWLGREHDPGWRQALEDFVARTGHPPARYQLGLLCLVDAPDRGEQLLRQAAQDDPEARPAVAEALAAHFRARGDRARAAPYEAELEAHAEHMQRAMQARSRIPDPEALGPPGLDPETLAELHAVLREHRNVAALRIAVISLQQAGLGPPHFLVGVEIRGLVLSESRFYQSLAHSLPLPGTFVVAPVREMSRDLRRRLERDGVRIGRESRTGAARSAPG